MSVAVRLAVALVVIVTPTLCFLGLMRGLEKLRDDALLARIAESDDAPQNASETASRALGSNALPAGRRVPLSETRTLDCSTCGEPNVRVATYCRQCLGELR